VLGDDFVKLLKGLNIFLVVQPEQPHCVVAALVNFDYVLGGLQFPVVVSVREAEVQSMVGYKIDPTCLRFYGLMKRAQFGGFASIVT